MTDIKLFSLKGKGVTEIPGETSHLERPLQILFEDNLDKLLSVHFLASEYAIKSGRLDKGGRMDTLGIDENKRPVIIEYKRNSNENIINQGLFYLDWLMDHKANFKLLVMEKMGGDVAEDVDWTAPRLICVAGNFTHYDQHAIKQMDRNIELIRYERFGEDLMVLQLLTATTAKTNQVARTGSGRVRKKGKATPKQREHKQALVEAPADVRRRYEDLKEFMQSLGDDVQEIHLKHYTAFKRIKNFACVRLFNRIKRIVVWVPLNPNDFDLDGEFLKDVSKVGHLGTGNLQITIASDDDLERAKSVIEVSYEK